MLSDEVEAWFEKQKNNYADILREELKKTGVTETLESEVKAILQDANTKT